MKFSILAVLGILGVFSVQAIDPDLLERLINDGFTVIGSLSGNGRAGYEDNLLLSPEIRTQSDALSICKGYGGALLSILSVYHDNGVRDALNKLDDESFWASGQWDSNIQNWYWEGVRSPVHYRNFRQGCPQEQVGQGITVQGKNSAYGWCSAWSTSALRYICAFG